MIQNATSIMKDFIVYSYKPKGVEIYALEYRPDVHLFTADAGHMFFKARKIYHKLLPGASVEPVTCK